MSMMGGVDSVRIGRQLRALRRRQRLRQSDVARRSGVSRSEIGRAERGMADGQSVARLQRIAAALGARLDVRLSWNGEALDRLLDADHAAIVEQFVGRLTASSWECAVEVSFNLRGERGSVDILARHPRSGMGLVVEVKTVVPDLQSMLTTLDRKARLAPLIAAQRGWSIRGIGRLLVVAESRTSRRRVEAHRAMLAAALPDRALAVRRWLGDPMDRRSLAGLLFLPPDRPVAPRHRVRRATRAIRPDERIGDGAQPEERPPSDPLPGAR
jgi:transcriptional regulator with XRE-family HTH domain